MAPPPMWPSRERQAAVLGGEHPVWSWCVIFPSSTARDPLGAALADAILGVLGGSEPAVLEIGQLTVLETITWALAIEERAAGIVPPVGATGEPAQRIGCPYRPAVGEVLRPSGRGGCLAQRRGGSGLCRRQDPGDFVGRLWGVEDLQRLAGGHRPQPSRPICPWITSSGIS